MVHPCRLPAEHVFRSRPDFKAFALRGQYKRRAAALFQKEDCVLLHRPLHAAHGLPLRRAAEPQAVFLPGQADRRCKTQKQSERK